MKEGVTRLCIIRRCACTCDLNEQQYLPQHHILLGGLQERKLEITISINIWSHIIVREFLCEKTSNTRRQPTNLDLIIGNSFH